MFLCFACHETELFSYFALSFTQTSGVQHGDACGDAIGSRKKSCLLSWLCETRYKRVWKQVCKGVKSGKKVSFVWSLTTRFTTYSQLFVFQVWKHWQVMLSLVMLIIYMVCHRRLLGPWWPCTRLTNYSRSVAYKWTCAFSRFSSHCLFRLYPLLVIFLPIIFSNDSV